MSRQHYSLGRLTILGFLVTLMIGCASDSAQVDRALLANRTPAVHADDRATRYVVHYPDVLNVTIPTRPEWSGRHPINADGRIALGGIEFPRVDGRTTQEIARLVAGKCGLPESQVEVQVAEHNSQRLYILSEAPGLERVVAYQGPESIVELLQRVGGVTQRGAPGDIQVVRAHVAEGKSPEVFHVDLEAILLKQDPRSNVTLESFDQIYIAQSRGSCALSCIPPVLRPLFRKLCGMGRR